MKKIETKSESVRFHLTPLCLFFFRIIVSPLDSTIRGSRFSCQNNCCGTKSTIKLNLRYFLEHLPELKIRQLERAPVNVRQKKTKWKLHKKTEEKNLLSISFGRARKIECGCVVFGNLYFLGRPSFHSLTRRLVSPIRCLIQAHCQAPLQRDLRL